MARRKKKKKEVDWLIRVNRNEATGELLNSWLKSFDPDAEEGRGLLETTDDRDEAMVFSSMEEAELTWFAQSTVAPTRTDGKPNRPLSAWTIEIRPKEKESGMPWGAHGRRVGQV